MYFLLVQTVIASARLTIKNNCDFEIKPFFKGGDAMAPMAPGATQALTAPIRGDRMYFGPSDFIDGGGNKEVLGFLEFNAHGQSINLNPSMVDFVGLPMLFEKKVGGKVAEQTGCNSSNYQSLASFQSHIKNHCPGKVTKLDSKSTDLYYCASTFIHDITGTKIDSTWNVEVTMSSSKLLQKSSCSAPDLGAGDAAKVKIGNCSGHCLFGSQEKGALCAGLNRGAENKNDPSSFYSKPSPYDPTQTNMKWEFNPYAAFVHLICGPTIFAFPTDDQGAHGGYISAGPNEEAVITICPSAGSGPNSPGVLPPSSSSSSANGPSSNTSSTTASSSATGSEASSTSSTTVSPTDSGSDSSSSTSSTTVSPSESEGESSSSTSSTTASTDAFHI